MQSIIQYLEKWPQSTGIHKLTKNRYYLFQDRVFSPAIWFIVTPKDGKTKIIF